MLMFEDSTTTSDEDARLAGYLAANPDQGYLRACIQKEQQLQERERRSLQMCHQQAQQHVKNWRVQTELLQRLRRKQSVLGEAILMLHDHEPEIKAEMVAEMNDLACHEREAQRVAESEKQAQDRVETEREHHLGREAQSLEDQSWLETRLQEMQARGR